MKYNNQKGVGLVEVLVALFLLAVAVLGFAALQLRAVDASLEASKQVLALTIARDLAERMRANPQAVRDGAYVVGAVSVPTSEMVATVGDAASIAKQDLNIAALNAKNNGMNLSISECPTGAARQCIYVAWEETSLSGNRGIETCIKDGVYVKGSHCLFLEAY
ncbi:type IV pilus modification protein PilV [Acinetobacter haemolyticus]|uniref:type IV pilus modification protein PilV n=1 Tax=Acinetobacter haemolyticus TaxID=29430 RepID=UPI0013725D03|nr:type IV pilus modification protein PilV [Acinetobacter haemolyticus]NAR62657.1 type IV pilus modification protein PilV [Acinetobacter haemolyticus]